MVVRDGCINKWKFICITICFIFIGMMYNQQNAAGNVKLPYYIKVNKQQNTVTIYEKDAKGNYTVPIKAMRCTVGYSTPLGVYKTPVKYRWKLLNNDVWGQYSTRIVGGILFHSVYYYEKDPSTLAWNQYNKLGTTASQGCVRLTVEDAKWIYDNCPIGTTVEIYEDKNPGPLGKPETIQLKSGTKWDPTDPSLDNPFLNKNPIITGVEDKVVDMGSKWNPLIGVKASSTTGFSITNKIKVTGTVDTKKEGSYEVIYEVIDAIGRSHRVTSKVEVVKSTIAPRFMGVGNRYLNSDVELNRSYALEGVKAYHGTSLLSDENIVVKINKGKDDNYQVIYEVTAANGYTAQEKVVFYLDKTAPSIEVYDETELSFNQWLNYSKEDIKKLILKETKVLDNMTDEELIQLDVQVKEKNNYTYSVEYLAIDLAGNKAKSYSELTYYSNSQLHGIASNYNLPYGTKITKDYLLQEVYATDSYGNDCSEKIHISINQMDDNYYHVTYKMMNETEEELVLDAFYRINEE